MEVKANGPAVSPQVLHEIDSIQLSKRLKDLRERYFAESPVACGERVQLSMESWNKTRGQDIELRRAKMVKNIAEHIPVVIHKGEQTAASVTRFFRGAYPYIDYDSGYLKDPGMIDIKEKGEESEVTFASPRLVGRIPEDVLAICNRAEEVFKDQTPAEKMRQVAKNVFGDWYDDVMELKASIPRYEELPMMPGVTNWEKLICHGLRSVINDAESKLKNFVEEGVDSLEKLYFWQAVILVCEGAITLSKRYAQTARELALAEKDALDGLSVLRLFEARELVELLEDAESHEQNQGPAVPGSSSTVDEERRADRDGNDEEDSDPSDVAHRAGSRDP